MQVRRVSGKHCGILYSAHLLVSTIGLNLPIFQGVDDSENARHWAHTIIMPLFAVENT